MAWSATSKSSAPSYTAATKHSASFSSQTKSTSLGIWDVSTLTWQLSLPWQVGAPGIISWTSQTKS